jgi:hypothetical protein
MMTTAYTTLNDGLAGAQNGQLPWAQGAGHVNINKATDPGLVYDAGKADYVAYQCKVNKAAVPASDCTTYGTLDETYNLNLPSITVGSVVGSTVVKRKVTNVGNAAATYTSAITVPGFNATVNPASLTLNPGETKSFNVTITPNGAVENVWGFGAMAWSDGTHTVLSPVQARVGKAITAPSGLTANTASGSRLFTVKTGFAGRMGVAKGGLKAVTLGAPVSLSPNPNIGSSALRSICAAGNDTANVKVTSVAIPANTVVARFALRDADVGSPGADDFDMMILYPDGTTNLYSGNDGSNEAVQIASPAAGNYKVCVTSFATANGGPSTFKLSSWVVTRSDLGGGFNALVPSTVYAGGNATVGLSWSGLALGGRYLGAAQFLDLNGAVQATTVLRVETNGGLPVTEVQDSSTRKLGGN